MDSLVVTKSEAMAKVRDVGRDLHDILERRAVVDGWSFYPS
jgi:hypothetical protein